MAERCRNAPACTFYAVHGDLCSGCAGRLAPGPEARIDAVVTRVLNERDIEHGNDLLATDLCSTIVSGASAREAMTALVVAFREHYDADPTLLTTEQAARVARRVREAGVIAEKAWPDEHCLYGVILSFCATPWECAANDDFSRTAVSYYANSGEVPVDERKYRTLLEHLDSTLAGRMSHDDGRSMLPFVASPSVNARSAKRARA